MILLSWGWLRAGVEAFDDGLFLFDWTTENGLKKRTSVRNQLLIDKDPYIPVWSVAGSTPLSNFFSSSWTFDFSDPSGVVGTDLSPSRFEIMAKINLIVAYLILPFWLAWLLYQE